jgi:hypothetical protein
LRNEGAIKPLPFACHPVQSAEKWVGVQHVAVNDLAGILETRNESDRQGGYLKSVAGGGIRGHSPIRCVRIGVDSYRQLECGVVRLVRRPVFLSRHSDRGERRNTEGLEVVGIGLAERQVLVSLP